MMKQHFKFAWGLVALVGSLASAESTYKRVEMENQIRSRVTAIVEKADPMALVQVQITLKKVQTTNLPVVGFGAEVTPVEYDGELGASSIESIGVRVVTQVATLPDWVRKEVDQAVKSSEVKVSVKFEKAKGALSESELPKIAKDTSDVFIKGVEGFKSGAWMLVAGLVVALLTIAGAVFVTAGRLEGVFARLIDAKLAPLMQAVRGQTPARERGEGAQSSAKAAAPATIAAGPGGTKELADLPHEALLTLFADCYWTQSDGYAHYLWTQTSQEQRERVLAANVIDADYFWFVRDFATENLGYHLDARYLTLGTEFRDVDQAQLLDFVRANRTQYRLVTPMRYEALDLSLAERLEFMKQTDLASVGARTKPAFKAAGQRRRLPAKLAVKRLQPSDETYLWENAADVPVGVRGSLKSLVWLALAPTDYVTQLFGELDARALASAWTGPEDALKVLEGAMPAKKLEMMKHILSTEPASRESDVFAYLAEAGANAPVATEVAAVEKAA